MRWLNLQGQKSQLGNVVILSFQTDRSGKTENNQIKLTMMEQPDQGLYSLQFCQHLLDTLGQCKLIARFSPPPAPSFTPSDFFIAYYFCQLQNF